MEAKRRVKLKYKCIGPRSNKFRHPLHQNYISFIIKKRREREESKKKG